MCEARVHASLSACVCVCVCACVCVLSNVRVKTVGQNQQTFF